MVMKFSREQKLQILAKIQEAFEERFGEPIGELAAEQWLDFMLKELAPYVYNQAIADARAILQQRMANLEDDLYALEKTVAPAKRV